MRLSFARADMVAEYLEMRGVDLDRIKVEGKGETEPLAVNRFTNGSVTHLGRYLNRQVYVTITGTLPSENSLNGVYIPSNLVPTDNLEEAKVREQHFTIQLSAVGTPAPESQFAGLEVREFACNDGLYRYTTESFRTFQEAKRRLLILRQQGYPDAFIQTFEWYKNATE